MSRTVVVGSLGAAALIWRLAASRDCSAARCKLRKTRAGECAWFSRQVAAIADAVQKRPDSRAPGFGRRRPVRDGRRTVQV